MGGSLLPPEGFHQVCTTELGAVAKLLPEFTKRRTKVMGLSVNALDAHQRWNQDIKDVTGHAPNLPMIADPERKISLLYDMIHPNASDTFTDRSVLIIGPDNKVKLTLTYPASAGRNLDEILRVIDALQLSAQFPVSTPADWRPGDDVIVAPSLSTEDALKKFPEGVLEKKPYLRTTPQPDL